jgi:hypothetical protein
MLQTSAGLAKDVSEVATAVALGQGVTNTHIAESAGILGVSVVNATAGTNNLVLSQTNAINQNVIDSKYATLVAINTDGDKTRALIQDINTAALNRQIVVAENKLAEALSDHRFTKSGVEVTTVVNQAQAQSQAQQQAILTNQLLNTLVSELQVAKANIVNLGTMSGSAGQQSSTNVRA